METKEKLEMRLMNLRDLAWQFDSELEKKFRRCSPEGRMPREVELALAGIHNSLSYLDERVMRTEWLEDE